MKEGGRKLIVRMMQCEKNYPLLTLKMDQAKEHRQPLEARKGKETGSSLEPPEVTQPCWHLDFNPAKPSWISDHQNSKVINLCCFQKSLSLWCLFLFFFFSTAAIGNLSVHWAHYCQNMLSLNWYHFCHSYCWITTVSLDDDLKKKKSSWKNVWNSS